MLLNACNFSRGRDGAHVELFSFLKTFLISQLDREGSGSRPSGLEASLVVFCLFVASYFFCFDLRVCLGVFDGKGPRQLRNLPLLSLSA